MNLPKSLIGLGIAGSLALAVSAAFAQDGPNISVNVLQRVSSKPPTGAPAGSGSEEPMGNKMSAAGAAPAADPGNGGAASGDITAATSTVSETTARPRRKRLPRAGGDPLTLAAAGSMVLSAGYALRRRIGLRSA